MKRIILAVVLVLLYSSLASAGLQEALAAMQAAHAAELSSHGAMGQAGTDRGEADAEEGQMVDAEELVPTELHDDLRYIDACNHWNHGDSCYTTGEGYEEEGDDDHVSGDNEDAQAHYYFGLQDYGLAAYYWNQAHNCWDSSVPHYEWASTYYEMAKSHDDGYGETGYGGAHDDFEEWPTW